MNNENIIYKNQRSWSLIFSSSFLLVFLSYTFYRIHGPFTFSFSNLITLVILAFLAYFCLKYTDPRTQYILYESSIWIRKYGNIPYSEINKVKGEISSIHLHSFYSIYIQVNQNKNEIRLNCVDEKEFKTVKNKLNYRVKKNRC